jgi:hypothetical protein
MAKKPKIKLDIPNPCNENWDKMTPREQGRFCSQCSKHVVDFTKVSDKELLHYLTLAKGETCGRFNPEQLDRFMSTRSQSSTSLFRKLLLGTTLSMGIAGATAANNNTKPPKENIQSTIDGKLKGTDRKVIQSDTIYINGLVIDSATHEYLAYASVLLETNGMIASSTDADEQGLFSLAVIPKNMGNKATLHVSYMAIKRQISILSIRKIRLKK